MDRARDLIAEHLGVSRTQIHDQASFRDLGADSLDLVSLTMVFEEAFDLSISDEQAEACVTVGDAFGLLEQQLRKRQSDPAKQSSSALADVRG